MEATATSRSGAPAGPSARGAAIAVAGWLLLLVVAHLVGQSLVDDDPLVRIGAPPLVGQLDLHLSARILPALLVGVAAIAWAPGLATRLHWRALLPASWAGGVVWMVTLAGADGWSAITAPLGTRYEYLAALPQLRGTSVHGFLSSYTSVLNTYPTHVKGHPPGFTLVLWGLDAIGLGGTTVAAIVVIAVGALVAPAALVAARTVSGEALARSAAPFLAFMPAAVWMATTADAFFAGLAASGIALFAVAVRRRDVPGGILAVSAGVVLGAALECSYGIAPLGLLVLALAAVTRRWDALALGALGVAVVLGGVAALGFWWVDGLDATRTLYTGGVAVRRPYASFLLISLAAFACATGPAPWAGLTRLRMQTAWLLPGVAVAAVLVADLSGLSKGENERIWLPFVPWVMLAAAGLSRRWLASALALGIILQVGLRSPW